MRKQFSECKVYTVNINKNNNHSILSKSYKNVVKAVQRNVTGTSVNINKNYNYSTLSNYYKK